MIMKKILLRNAMMIIMALSFTSCATIFANETACHHRPGPGEANRQVRPAPLIIDVFLGGPVWVGIDFATGAIYRPCNRSYPY